MSEEAKLTADLSEADQCSFYPPIEVNVEFDATKNDESDLALLFNPALNTRREGKEYSKETRSQKTLELRDQLK